MQPIRLRHLAEVVWQEHSHRLPVVFVSTATGQINLSASTPGTYTVTNTMAASGGCAAVTATTSSYHYDITCSYDQLCGNTILFFSRWCTGSHTDGHGGWELFFNCRINDQCSNRCDYSELKHCRNLYCYLYNGCSGRMCSPNSDYFSYDYCSAGSNVQLYGNTIIAQNAANPSTNI